MMHIACFRPRIGGQDDISPQMGGAVPALAPPPRSPITAAYADDTPRINPFDGQENNVSEVMAVPQVPQSGELHNLFKINSSILTPKISYVCSTSRNWHGFPKDRFAGDPFNASV